MNSSEVRNRFLEFFRERGHEVVASSPLVPANDPTLLFTNAGMVQFKDVFLGTDQRPYVRAASSQRCVRAGGKHNDLENVGYTARHHTFFEMLGNFSFGDYFKREAIRYGWEFVTGELGLPPERLWVTVYEEDDEAADIWLEEIGVDAGRFRRMGAKDNFWAMGDTGPCGPCSEIFYDHGPAVPGGPPGTPYEDGDRYVEIWNLVFMQFDRAADGTMTPLPKPSVDTGMGLERVAAVMQGVHSNYQIDIFSSLVRAAAEIAGEDRLDLPSLHVIADHIRACAFLIADGVLPSNEGRGYVLRRIIRRAIRHGYKLDIHEPFFNRLVEPLETEMGEAYPELTRQRPHVERVLRQEEERFSETLEQGMRVLEESIGGLRGTVIPGKIVFKLYDTYGFPVDLTEDIARERQLTVDHPGFKQEMDKQRSRARAASKFGDTQTTAETLARASLPPTQFTGYETLEDRGEVLALFSRGEPVEELAEGGQGEVVLDVSPFYAESGGQVGDTGTLRAEGLDFEVRDTLKAGEASLHSGQATDGRIKVGDKVQARVDGARREAIVLNHSATHLMHAALREVLGDHVTQKGSLVAPDRLRFDFSHYEAVTPEQIREVEDLVNREIRGNVAAETRLMDFDEAMKLGAMALFGEKYGDQVRVMSLGDFSTELCGGTHVKHAGDIGLFKIVHEGGIAAGVRRIEAVTGAGALDWIRAGEQALDKVAGLVRGNREDLDAKVRGLVERGRKLEKELDRLKAQLAGSQGVDIASQAVEVQGIKVLAARIDGADAKALRDAMDRLKNKLGTSVVVLGSKLADDKVALVAGVSRDCTDRIKAGEVISAVAAVVGGRGGGRPDMAQAGGRDAAKLDDALKIVPGWVAEHLA